MWYHCLKGRCLEMSVRVSSSPQQSVLGQPFCGISRARKPCHLPFLLFSRDTQRKAVSCMSRLRPHSCKFLLGITLFCGGINWKKTEPPGPFSVFAASCTFCGLTLAKSMRNHSFQGPEHSKGPPLVNGEPSLTGSKAGLSPPLPALSPHLVVMNRSDHWVVGSSSSASSTGVICAFF